LEQLLKGNQYIIICVDALTTHLTSFPTRNETIAAVIKFFREEIIPKYGLFSIITTDNSPCFISKLFKEFLIKLNIKHNNFTEYTPTANAMSERYVQTLINCIKSFCSMVSKDWEKHLRNCVFSINNSCVFDINPSVEPFQNFQYRYSWLKIFGRVQSDSKRC
jgi:hypothetical protein